MYYFFVNFYLKIVRLKTIRHPYAKKINLDTDAIPITKINSKWLILDLNVKHKIIKLLEDNVEENLEDSRFGNDFLDTTQSQDPWKNW